MQGNRSSFIHPLGAVAIALAMLAAACASPSTVGESPSETTSTTTTPSNLGGDRLPVQMPTEDYGHGASRVTGTLSLEPNGCWTVDLGDGPRLVVFPPGYDKPPDDGSLMRSPGGLIVRSGMAIDGIGGIVPMDRMPDVPDGYWGGYLTFCGPERPEVAVLDSIEPAFDPTGLTGDDIVAMIRSAAMTTSWPCGLGFAASNDEQTVAVQVYQTGIDGGLEPPITLPDAAWDARVVVGKNLMANNCDDVMEGWEPIREVVAEWPISAGVLTFEPPAEEGCGIGGSVEATLAGAIATSPGGDTLELSDVTTVNEAYGCFAG